MTDQEFLQRFESGGLEALPHADHVRAAFLYLDRHDADRALDLLMDGILRFATAKNVPEKFHYTLTRAWTELLSNTRARHPEARTAEALLDTCPALADPRTIDRFYSPDAIASTAARQGWVEPDRAPLDSLLPSEVHAGGEEMPSANPIIQFRQAIARAQSLGIDTTPMALATADANGRPSVRIVLMRGVDERGFVFHTNYTSRKARELTDNPHAALCLHWPSIEEQIRIEGTVARLPADESDAYFATRPRGSQIGAWASTQSQVLPARVGPRGATRRGGGPLRRPGRPAPALLGRLPHHTPTPRILVRTHEPPARSHRLHPQR